MYNCFVGIYKFLTENTAPPSRVQPSSQPTRRPSSDPSSRPSSQPIRVPSSSPSRQPSTLLRSASPSASPTDGPSSSSSLLPSPMRRWRGVASDSTGRLVAAVVYGGGIYYSSDYGESWAVHNSSANPRNWTSISSDSTGRYLFAGESGWMDPSGEYLSRGGLYMSGDFGNSWSFKLAGDFWYNSIACSSNGTRVAAADGEGGIYLSSDRGNTWALSSARDRYGNYWVSVTMSDTGQYLAAGTWASGIYVSVDYGVTWAQSDAPKSQYWVSLTSDSTGRLLAAGSLTGQADIELGVDAIYGSIYTSSDYGASWALASNAPSGDWIGVVSSVDGRNLTAIEQTTGVYRSGDYGKTWHVAFDSNSTWQGLASDLSLDHVYATTDGGGKHRCCALIQDHFVILSTHHHRIAYVHFIICICIFVYLFICLFVYLFIYLPIFCVMFS